MTVTATRMRLKRAIPKDRMTALIRMEKLMRDRGYNVERLDLESAWSNACLENINRPAWDLVKFVDDDQLFNRLMAYLEPIATADDPEQDEEDEDEDAGEEQDDGESTEGEDGGEPAEDEDTVPAAPEAPVARRRGRPPKKR